MNVQNKFQPPTTTATIFTTQTHTHTHGHNIVDDIGNDKFVMKKKNAWMDGISCDEKKNWNEKFLQKLIQKNSHTHTQLKSDVIW